MGGGLGDAGYIHSVGNLTTRPAILDKYSGPAIWFKTIFDKQLIVVNGNKIQKIIRYAQHRNRIDKYTKKLKYKTTKCQKMPGKQIGNGNKKQI